MKFFFILLFFLYSCKNIEVSKNIDNEQTFYYKAKMNLYSNLDNSKIIKSFLEYAYLEKKAKEMVEKKCKKFINENNLKDVECKFMGTKHTEKISTSLN
jgi:hypothetical protein